MWRDPPPLRDGWLRRSASTLTKRTCCKNIHIYFSETLCLCGVPKEQGFGGCETRSGDAETHSVSQSHHGICDSNKENPVSNGELTEKCKSPTASDILTTVWKPVLLVIPLRLGLSEINPMYIQSLKVSGLKEHSSGNYLNEPNQPVPPVVAFNSC